MKSFYLLAGALLSLGVGCGANGPGPDATQAEGASDVAQSEGASDVAQSAQALTACSLTIMKKLTLTLGFQGRPSDKTTVTVTLFRGPYSPVATATGTPNSAGAVNLYFGGIQDGQNYYIVVKTPHSIETWSATGKSFVNGTLAYDFTTSVNQAYGGNMHLNTATGKAEIIEGDVNQDGFIEVMDQSAVYNDRLCMRTGFATDLNADGVVNQTDLDIVYSNVAIGAEVARPY
jgi:Dockerin type I domain